MNHNRKGLRKTSPELLVKATEDTATQASRILLTFVGTAIFCVLALLTPDSALLSSSEKINLPFAGPVSFFGFIILAPVILIAQRIYLQVYVDHELRLNRVSSRISMPRPPGLVPSRNPVLQGFRVFVLFFLLPLEMAIFTWKAFVFPPWGLSLLAALAVVVTMHLLIPFRSFSWRIRALLSVSVGGLVLGVIIWFVPPFWRTFNLSHANLSGLWLPGEYLGGANLVFANLEGTFLKDANLAGADLSFANLKNTNLEDANLNGAILTRANFKDSVMVRAKLVGANLRDADLTGVRLTSADLREAIIIGADLTGASITGAGLENAYLADTSLIGAHLTASILSNADLEQAILRDAILVGALLSKANLRGADLSGAVLSGAILQDAIITQQQLNEACGDERTRLPPGLKAGRICPNFIPPRGEVPPAPPPPPGFR